MKIFIGLGNPGEKYKNTRHNVGYLLADENSKINILKTNTFMNDSGTFVYDKIKKFGLNLDDLYIIHDDLDIKLGDFKIQFGKGPKDHNGLNDIYEKLGTNEFWHVRIGIDNRNTVNKMLGEEYVLEDFTEEEMIILKNTIKKVLNKLPEN